jgi:tRNA(adenine34) deaminase
VGHAGALRDVRGRHRPRAIDRVYYAAPDPKGGAVEHGARVFDQPGCLHRPEVYSGMGESEAADLLRAFFRERR